MKDLEVDGEHTRWIETTAPVLSNSENQYEKTLRQETLICFSAASGVIALLIINKAGGLIYNRTFGEGLNQLNSNDYLVLAGTFHGPPTTTPSSSISTKPAAASEAAAARAEAGKEGPLPSRPEPPSGLEVMETENFRLQCFNTQTGTKFLLFTDTMQANVDVAMRKVYDLYADYVMKNPFYQLEMPVRCDMFDRKLNSYIREINNSR
ncbi:sybindin-like family protein [Apiospora kogelbergensis]|uniref:sybindin-like family protein n=1 Tax=Apiospora kogelbergensis TaxID=1337665 RepID=UPI00312F5889